MGFSRKKMTGATSTWRIGARCSSRRSWTGLVSPLCPWPHPPHVQASASFWQSLPHYLQGVNGNWILTMKNVSLIWRFFFRNLFASFSVPITKIMAGEQKLSRRWPSLWSQIASLRVAHCFGTVFLLRNYQSTCFHQQGSADNQTIQLRENYSALSGRYSKLGVRNNRPREWSEQVNSCGDSTATNGPLNSLSTSNERLAKSAGGVGETPSWQTQRSCQATLLKETPGSFAGQGCKEQKRLKPPQSFTHGPLSTNCCHCLKRSQISDLALAGRIELITEKKRMKVARGC